MNRKFGEAVLLDKLRPCKYDQLFILNVETLVHRTWKL
jgi:hypothetical protein